MLCLRLLGPSIWLPILMVLWGVVTVRGAHLAQDPCCLIESRFAPGLRIALEGNLVRRSLTPLDNFR